MFTEPIKRRDFLVCFAHGHSVDWQMVPEQEQAELQGIVCRGTLVCLVLGHSVDGK
jgi:hypothetical protein